MITKQYRVADCAVFCRVRDEHGGCSNMAGGFIIRMGETEVRASEHLYQAMRFTEHPDLQRELIAISNPMQAKFFAKKHEAKTRADWLNIRVPVMEWSLDLKLLNNIDLFGGLLLSTGDKEIVEYSTKDDTFWGTIHTVDGDLIGMNTLGVLLVSLRQRLVQGLAITCELRRPIPDFFFFGEDAVSLAKSGLVV